MHSSILSTIHKYINNNNNDNNIHHTQYNVCMMNYTNMMLVSELNVQLKEITVVVIMTNQISHQHRRFTSTNKSVSFNGIVKYALNCGCVVPANTERPTSSLPATAAKPFTNIK